jgi:hypothetical protein
VVIDADLLVYTLLAAAAPEGVRVTPETDTEVLGDLPLWQYHLIGNGQISNGPGMYSYVLDLSVFAEGLDATRAQARLAYDAVHAWEIPAAAIVPGIGWVTGVDDVSILSLQGTPEITGRQVSQYAGSFDLALRN